MRRLFRLFMCLEYCPPIFMYPSGLSLNVISLRGPLLYGAPQIVLLHIQSLHILFHKGQLHMFVLIYLFPAFLSH